MENQHSQFARGRVQCKRWCAFFCARPHAFPSAALQGSCLTAWHKPWAGLKYHIHKGGRDYWNVAKCRCSEQTLIYSLVLSAERHEHFIRLSAVSGYAKRARDRWLRRRGTEVSHLQVSISYSAWMNLCENCLADCCLARSPISSVFFNHVF